MKLYKTGKIEDAVWVSAVVHAYEKFQFYSEQNAQKSLNNFYFNSKTIVGNAYNLLKKAKNEPILIETFIGNIYGKKYNFFSGDENEIRLSKLNEYLGYRVCPFISENNGLLETFYGGICINDLIEWYVYEYNVLR